MKYCLWLTAHNLHDDFNLSHRNYSRNTDIFSVAYWDTSFSWLFSSEYGIQCRAITCENTVHTMGLTSQKYKAQYRANYMRI